MAKRKVSRVDERVMRGRVELAAKLRARGATWAQVAEKIGYKSGSSCERTLTGSRFRDWFNECIEREVQEWIKEGLEPQALEVMRKLMEKIDSGDIDDRRLAESAAHSVINHSAKLRATVLDLHHSGELKSADDKLIEETRRAANLSAS